MINKSAYKYETQFKGTCEIDVHIPNKVEEKNISTLIHIKLHISWKEFSQQDYLYFINNARVFTMR